jgi:hypothetical protein
VFWTACRRRRTSLAVEVWYLLASRSAIIMDAMRQYVYACFLNRYDVFTSSYNGITCAFSPNFLVFSYEWPRKAVYRTKKFFPGHPVCKFGVYQKLQMIALDSMGAWKFNEIQNISKKVHRKQKETEICRHTFYPESLVFQTKILGRVKTGPRGLISRPQKLLR